jgi:Fe-S oxidoreductase
MRVLVWPDTFTNFFEPEVGAAAVEALEQAGFEVALPRPHLCCGRPLYDYGFLGLAREYLERVVDELRDEVQAGTPVVGLEPSCVAVFRDELPKMIPDDEDAKRLARQTFHFAEFLAEHAGEYEPPPLERRVLLHGHCHERATGGFEPAERLLERMGAQVAPVDSGCCGMAGAWGYEHAHYDVSVACAERALLPAVRDAAPQTLIVSDGFSCRSQIEQLDGERRALHLAQLLQLAYELGPAGPAGRFPEHAAARLSPSPRRRLRAAAIAGGVGATVAAAAWRHRR